jgi:mevalonate pyrophosphate decarboxylase
MKVTLKKAFSILDGRLSTEMDDVYEMLNYIFDDDLMTHQLPSAMRKLKEINPEWFKDAVSTIDEIKHIEGTNDFEHLMKIIDREYSNFEIELKK